MSQTQNIRLPHLIITEIKDNQIKIKLDISSNENHEEIYKLFSQIRHEYVGWKDQYDGVHFPLKYLRDQYSGEIVEDSDFLIIKNIPKSIYYDQDNQKLISFKDVTDRQKVSPLEITAYVDLTYTRSYGRHFFNANISKAIVNLPKPSISEDLIIDMEDLTIDTKREN